MKTQPSIKAPVMPDSIRHLLRHAAGLIMGVLLTLPANAQIGTCEQARAEAFLDVGNVRAAIYNNGALFWKGGSHTYDVPKEGERWEYSIFNAVFQVGGLIDGEIRTSATSYGPWEFWPGPLNSAGNPPADCSAYDYIWEINRRDLQQFIDEGILSPNMKNWPWELGAPVMDGDGDPNNYNLQEGDLPELLGDQRFWWVMNDRGNEHNSYTGSEPIGLEVHGTAFAFNRSSTIDNHTFYSFKIINKNKKPFTDAYTGLFVDVDLGNFDDDYVGSDSTHQLVYGYNADNDDEGGYGEAPPAVGLTFFESIIPPPDGEDNNQNGLVDEQGEKVGMFGAMRVYKSGPITGFPRSKEGFYNYLRLRWQDGEEITYGGDGRNYSTTPTRYMFSGDPVTNGFGTEKKPAVNWHPYQPADRRFQGSTGPFNLMPNEGATVKFAVLWARGNSNLDSITKLREEAGLLHLASDFYYSPTVVEKTQPEYTSPPRYLLGFDQNYPNPFTNSTTIRYSLPKPMQVKLTIHDVLGRELEVLVDTHQAAGIYTTEFNAKALPAGLYLARLQLDHLSFTKRMVLTR